MTLAAALAVLAAFVTACSSAQPSTDATGYETAQEACQAPASATKGGSQLTFNWSLAVRMDQADVAVLLLVSGPNELLCETAIGTDGRYAGATTGLGTVATSPGVSLDISFGTPGGDTRQILAGQAPAGTDSIDVTTSDGATVTGTVQNGRYLAWLDPGQTALEITARDSAGVLLSRLGDTGGLTAGAAATP